jgi:hypothetical protein
MVANSLRKNRQMAKIIARDTVKLFSFPESPERIEVARKSITGLTEELGSRYEIDLSISFENLHKRYPTFSAFLGRFYEKCKKHKIILNPEGSFCPLHILEILYRLIREPLSYEPAKNRDYLSIFARGKEELLQPLIDEARIYSAEWRTATGLQLHMLDETFVLPEGAHGVASEDARIALLIKKYPEIIYHEFFHLFGVRDGYNEVTKATVPGCEKCWMQWEPCYGNGLCETHLKELRGFLERMKEKEIG